MLFASPQQQEESIKFDPDLYHRRSIRLNDYDYSQSGAYFITHVTWKRRCLFGEIVDGVMKLNDAGFVAQTEWKKLPIRFPGMHTEDFVVMPDHLHGIIVIEEAKPEKTYSSNAPSLASPVQIEGKTRLLGTIIGSYKSYVARLVNGLRHTRGASVWQRNYYEQIIGNETELTNFRNYIIENPGKWEKT